MLSTFVFRSPGGCATFSLRAFLRPRLPAYFADEPHADYFAEPIGLVDQLLVPTLSLYEVFKRVLQQRGEGDALQGIALMPQGRVIDLDASTALIAARLGNDYKLAMADSVMLATARGNDAIFRIQDADFENFTGARYKRKKVPDAGYSIP